MANSNLYLDKLKEILDLQNQVFNIVKKGETVTNDYFETKEKLVAQLSILNYDENNENIIKLRQEIIKTEKEILKEANKMFNFSKLKILQHEKSIQTMVNYFKSQIESQSEIDFKV